MDKRTIKLAANIVDGVFEVHYIPPGATVRVDEIFAEDLSHITAGDTLYGIVNADVELKIKRERGIDYLNC